MEAGPERARGGTHRVEDMAANLTGDSKGAERRRGGGPTALERRIELGRAVLMGDDGGRRRRGGGGGGGEQEAWWEQGMTAARRRYRGGGLLSRVEPRPGTKGPLVN